LLGLCPILSAYSTFHGIVSALLTAALFSL
jgi:hypothetical protein